MVDVDDTVREVHGYAQQGAAFGYTKRCGRNIQLAVISTPLSAPVIARARLRSGNTASVKGAGRMLAQAITTARAAGMTSTLLCRADSAYYGWAFVGTAVRHQAWFSVTARMTKTVAAAIAAIPAQAWRQIEYPNAPYDEAEQRWVSDAEVAEVAFTAFTGRRKHEHVPCRLVVRRVKRLQPLPTRRLPGRGRSRCTQRPWSSPRKRLHAGVDATALQLSLAIGVPGPSLRGQTILHD